MNVLVSLQILLKSCLVHLSSLYPLGIITIKHQQSRGSCWQTTDAVLVNVLADITLYAPHSYMHVCQLERSETWVNL